MKINEGNIFESMRLLLPEHRAASAEFRRRKERLPQPLLDEQQLESLNWAMEQLLSLHLPALIQLEVFQNGKRKPLSGWLTHATPSSLHLQAEQRTHKIPKEDILRIHLDEFSD
ncbi:YolD-like family protein [Alicyclobacillus tolerans]|uniref:YolD-like protein n=1 Tax=Alicyclobacillus tolerans TaxID=90970 RepID=A0ABT9LYF3_9BACL|nr:YolD-like family protein [Alicyclobacillus tengchongensis]MDP9729299.1 hypothetical protein [Alicyclobacillus tengchongensis]